MSPDQQQIRLLDARQKYINDCMSPYDNAVEPFKSLVKANAEAYANINITLENVDRYIK